MPSPTALYRHFDDEGRLLYVGISLCAASRLNQHRKAAAWFVDIARVEVEWFADRAEASRAERRAVIEEGPLHNRAIPTLAFDSADFINTAEDVAAYLETYLEDGTPEELRQAINNVARSHGISDVSRKSNISRAGIYKALSDDGNPSFETIRSIIAALGLKLTVEPAERELERVG